MEPLVEELLRQSPVVVVLGLGLYLFYSGKIRSGKDYESMVDDRNFWRDGALRITNFAGITADALDRRKQRNRNTEHSENRGSGDGIS